MKDVKYILALNGFQANHVHNEINKKASIPTEESENSDHYSDHNSKSIYRGIKTHKTIPGDFQEFPGVPGVAGHPGY